MPIAAVRLTSRPAARSRGGRAHRVLPEFAEAWLEHLVVERGVSANTLVSYRSDLAAFAIWLDATQLDWLSVTPSDLSRYLSSRILEVVDADEMLRLAPSTVARNLAALRGLYGFLQDEGRIVVDPTESLQGFRMTRALPDVLTIDEVLRMLGQARRELDALAEIAAKPRALRLRDLALVELLYGTGARISEVLVLSTDDVARWDHGSEGQLVTLLGKGNKERRVPIGQFALDAIGAYLCEGRPHLLRATTTSRLFLGHTGRPLTRMSAWRTLEGLAFRAGLPHIHPHTLRHCYATHLLEGGAPLRIVQELLGHVSVATTELYTHLDASTLRSILLDCHPRARL